MRACQQRRCRSTARCCSTTPQREPARFVSFTLPELLRLTDQDHDELDALAGDEDHMRVWWRVRRWGWAVQDRKVAE